MQISDTPSQELTYLKIDSSHLVNTFKTHYNELIDECIYNAYLKDNILTLQRDKGDISIPFSLSNLPDVDSSQATSGMILVYNGTTWEAEEYIGGDIEYVRSDTSSRFNDVSNITSITDALDQILYPYIYPTFSSFTIISQLTTLEYGQYLVENGNNKTFSWGIGQIQNVSDDTGYTINDVTNAEILADNLLPKTTLTRVVTFVYDIRKTTSTTHTFSIVGRNTKNGNFTRNLIYTWRPRMYWGVSSSTTLNDSGIFALQSNRLSQNALGTYTIDGNSKYIWFVCPVTFGPLINEDGSNTKFIVGNLPNSSFLRFTYSHTNSYGHTESYYLYRTATIQTGSNIKIDIIS